MNTLIADANLFLRFLLNDIPNQYSIAKKLFSKAKNGQLEIIVPQIIIFEIAFSLDKYYHFPKTEMIDKLSLLIATQYFKIQDKEIFQIALNLYQSNNLSLTDCFLLAKSQVMEIEIFTFDKNLIKLL